MSFLCPNCHRPFTKEIVKREPTKEHTHDIEHSFQTRGWLPFSTDNPEEVVEFTHYCKCRHCGHEWKETKKVEFDRRTR